MIAWGQVGMEIVIRSPFFNPREARASAQRSISAVKRR
jgi:hypothetical protein